VEPARAAARLEEPVAPVAKEQARLVEERAAQEERAAERHNLRRVP